MLDFAKTHFSTCVFSKSSIKHRARYSPTAQFEGRWKSFFAKSSIKHRARYSPTPISGSQIESFRDANLRKPALLWLNSVDLGVQNWTKSAKFRVPETGVGGDFPGDSKFFRGPSPKLDLKMVLSPVNTTEFAPKHVFPKCFFQIQH